MIILPALSSSWSGRVCNEHYCEIFELSGAACQGQGQETLLLFSLAQEVEEPHVPSVCECFCQEPSFFFMCLACVRRRSLNWHLICSSALLYDVAADLNH